MAYGMPFESYEPHPEIPGAYNFTPTGGGNPILAAGPEAERMRSLLDRAPKPAMVASNSDNMSMPGPDASTMPPQPAPSRSDATQAAPAPAPGPSPEAAQAQPIPAMQPLPRPQGEQAQPGQQPVPVNGGLDVNKMLEVVHTKSGFVPTSQSVRTKGGIQNPEEQKLYTEAFLDQERAARDANEAQKIALQNAATQNAAAYKEASNKQMQLEAQQADLLAKQRIVDDEYNRNMKQAQQELDQMGRKELNPNRIWEGRTGAKLGSALAAGLGAFGSAFTRGPNFALEMVNKQIDDDIAAQRDQIARGTAAKQNDLMRIKDKYNVSTNTAEKLLALQNVQYAQVMARKQASMIGGQQAQIQLAQLDKQFADENAKRMKEYLDALHGEVETTAGTRYQQGGTSVRVNPYYKAHAEAEDLLRKESVAESTIEHQGQAPGKQGTGPGQGKASARLSGSLAINESAMQDIDNYMKDMPKGYVRTGEVSPLNPFGRASSSKERDHLDAMATAIVGKVVKGSNDSISESELNHFKEMLGSPYESVRKAGAEELRRALSTTNEGLNRAIERSRGNGGGAESAAEDQAP